MPKLENDANDEVMVHLVIQLKSTLEMVPQLLAALAPAQSKLLQAFHAVLQDPRFAQMLEKLSKVVHGSTAKVTSVLKGINQKIHVIQPKVRCAFPDRNVHSRMPSIPTPARLKRTGV
jgi:ribosomal protein S8